jgi:methionine biosynthesis protein MetW
MVQPPSADMGFAAEAGIRYDQQMVANWVPQGSRVLGLGCGEGELLAYLQQYKQVRCSGIEIDEARVASCIEKGLSVLQGDINTEVLDYPDESFDVVILAQTLQQIYAPDQLIHQILRIGKRCVVSFPSFSHWRARLQLLFKGRAPVTKQLPYQWYDTPNIRVIALEDFRRFARQVGFKIFKEVAINMNQDGTYGRDIRFWPDLRASYGLFLIGRAF